MIAGKDHLMHTYSTTVPEGAAQKTNDPAARALLEELAGSEQNSANWLVADPFEMGGMVLVPAMMFVSADTRASENPSSETGQIDLNCRSTSTSDSTWKHSSWKPAQHHCLSFSVGNDW